MLLRVMSYILGPSALGWTGGLVPGKFRNFQRLKAFILPISIAFIIRSLFFLFTSHFYETFSTELCEPELIALSRTFDD
jgi:hypothetical protein